MGKKKDRPLPPPVSQAEAEEILSIARITYGAYYSAVDRDHDHREDLIGAAVLYLLETWHKYDPTLASRRTWGVLKAHSAMRDHLRAGARAQGRGRDGRAKFTLVHLEHEIRVGPDDWAPLFEIIPGETDVQIDGSWISLPPLYEALGRLPERERAAMLLYANGLTMREVGTLLDVTESRIAQLIVKARKTLQRDERVLAAAA